MMFRNGLAIACITIGLLAPLSLTAQDDDNTSDTSEFEQIIPSKPRKWYWGNSLDAAIFSTATFSKPAKSDVLTPLRFSFVINFGFNFHYDFNRHAGIFTGLGIKNIGFIEKYRSQDSTVKRRVYTLGIPLGLKIGNLPRRKFFFIGGGADLAFNYKEKGFVRRGNKEKYNEWFSDRTPLIMPNVFVGASFSPGITLKAQYYPSNFLNTDYTETIGATVTKPYAGYDVHLILLSVGFDIHYKAKYKPEQDADYTM